MTTTTLSLYLIMHHIMKTYGTAEVQLHKFITLALHEGDGSDSHTSRCFPTVTQYKIERQQWGLKTGMDSMAKRTLSDPVRQHMQFPPHATCSMLILLPLKYWGFTLSKGCH